MTEPMSRMRRAFLATTRPIPSKEKPPADEPSHAGIDFLQKWMRTPNPMLGNVAPLSMLLLGRGEVVGRMIQDAYEAGLPPMTGLTCPHCGSRRQCNCMEGKNR